MIGWRAALRASAAFNGFAGQAAPPQTPGIATKPGSAFTRPIHARMAG